MTMTDREALSGLLFTALIIVFLGTWINFVQSVAGESPIQCIENPTFYYHIHTHLSIFVSGHAVTVPHQIGIINNILFCSLHTHAPDGWIHIESLVKPNYTLAQFLQVWNQTQPVTFKHVFGSNNYPLSPFNNTVLRDQAHLTIKK